MLFFDVEIVLGLEAFYNRLNIFIAFFIYLFNLPFSSIRHRQVQVALIDTNSTVD